MFRAYDPERERLVAIKLFKLDLPPERVHQLVAAFERLIAADLTHPVLAAPLATGMADVTAFLVQDYIGAESLDLAVRAHGPAPPADALRVAAQLAGALDLAAEVNIFHGALHPRDVLLSSDDTRLTGVGVARALEQVGVTAPVRRPYTAPERMAGASWDRRADVFSLASLLHELFWARRVSGLGVEAGEGLTPVEGSDAGALGAAFARALAENPDERFATALEFADALKRAFPGVAASNGRAASARPSKREARMELEPQLPLYTSNDPLADFADDARDSNDLALPASAAPSSRDADEVLNPPVARYEDVEISSASAEPAVSIEETPMPGPIGLITGHDPEAESAFERSRSAVWPLVLALTVGLAIGFAGGYGVGSHDRAPSAAVATTGAAPAGREFTESAVAEAPKPVAPVTPEPTPPAAATPAPQADPATGRLLVRTTPGGAQVSIDGKDVGRTPATVRDLARGPHRVRVTRDGYAAQERRVVISASRPAQSVNIALARAPVPPAARTAQAAPAAPAAASAAASRLPGALEVESRPAGAKVYLDGTLIGNTPLALPAVPPGEHAVRLEYEGYRLWASSIRIVPSERNRVRASLER